MLIHLSRKRIPRFADLNSGPMWFDQGTFGIFAACFIEPPGEEAMTKNRKNAENSGENPAAGGFESVREKVEKTIASDQDETDQARKRLLHGGNRSNQSR
ncbi:hypothetical protein [Novosphingobium terrae]|uniref:hypothetical protein n=1 Tax=Novosphingobium terrae TaxID=2726189 RepID=UPI00197F6FFA|nr:hypothetical protein [Novosphingobium terrae]